MTATPVVNITIPQGTDFSQTLTKTNPDGTAVNLAGFTGTATLKKFPSSKIPISFSVGITSITGQVAIGLTPGQTNPLNPGRYNYDIVLTSSSGVVSRMVEGMALITAGITT
jgi:hypothetical protein|tara:strand:- start:288 stop:623 length:336 start_codon:yes stop_codon:yes gene_type:complete